MNVSMADAFNLGWKLAGVLRGTHRPELLHTYSAERQVIAQELIDFDREFAKMFSAEPKSGADDAEGVDPAEFQAYFVRKGRFTAGTATHYATSAITAERAHQSLAEGLTVGMRLHSAPVIRLADPAAVAARQGPPRAAGLREGVLPRSQRHADRRAEPRCVRPTRDRSRTRGAGPRPPGPVRGRGTAAGCARRSRDLLRANPRVALVQAALAGGI